LCHQQAITDSTISTRQDQNFSGEHPQKNAAQKPHAINRTTTAAAILPHANFCVSLYRAKVYNMRLIIELPAHGARTDLSARQVPDSHYIPETYGQRQKTIEFI